MLLALIACKFQNDFCINLNSEKLKYLINLVVKWNYFHYFRMKKEQMLLVKILNGNLTHRF